MSTLYLPVPIASCAYYFKMWGGVLINQQFKRFGRRWRTRNQNIDLKNKFFLEIDILLFILILSLENFYKTLHRYRYDIKLEGGYDYGTTKNIKNKAGKARHYLYSYIL